MGRGNGTARYANPALTDAPRADDTDERFLGAYVYGPDEKRGWKTMRAKVPPDLRRALWRLAILEGVELDELVTLGLSWVLVSHQRLQRTRARFAS